MRIASSYRTVPESAVLVVSSVIPIDLLALERKYTYERRNIIERKRANAEARALTFERWQGRWTEAADGLWTKRLIPLLEPWVVRKFGDVNFYLTQFLMGHGYFRKYLRRMKKVTSPSCILCGCPEDTAEHTFFSCPRWDDSRAQLEGTVGPLSPENVIPTMLRSQENWNAIALFIERVLRQKKRRRLPGKLGSPNASCI